MTADEGVLSQDEVRTLLSNCLKHAGAAGVAEDKLERLVDWAEEARTRAKLLDLVIADRVAVGFRKGVEQPVFYVPGRPAA